jgi:hypothetical protein
VDELGDSGDDPGTVGTAQQEPQVRHWAGGYSRSRASPLTW